MSNSFALLIFRLALSMFITKKPGGFPTVFAVSQCALLRLLRKKLSNVVRSATLLEQAFERELQRNPANTFRFSKIFDTKLIFLKLIPAALKIMSA